MYSFGVPTSSKTSSTIHAKFIDSNDSDRQKQAFSAKGSDAIGIHYVATGATSNRIDYSLLPTLVSDPNGGRHSKVIGLNSNNTTEAKCAILNDASSLTSNVFVLAPSTTLAGYTSVGKEDITKEHPKLGQYCKEDDVAYRIAMVPLCMLITKTSHPVRGKANENTIGALEQLDDEGHVAKWGELLLFYYDANIHETIDKNKKELKKYLPPFRRGNYMLMLTDADGKSTGRSIRHDPILVSTDDDEYNKDVEALQKKLEQATAPNVPPGVPLTIQTTAAASVMDSAIPKKSRNKYLGTLGMAGEPINIDDATAGKSSHQLRYPFLCISHGA